MAGLLEISQRYKRCPGLRNYAPSSEVKVYRMIDGKKTLIRTEPAPLQSIKGDITRL